MCYLKVYFNACAFSTYSYYSLKNALNLYTCLKFRPDLEQIAL